MGDTLQPSFRPEHSKDGQERPHSGEPARPPEGRSLPSREVSGDRRSLCLAAVLLIVGELVYAVATPIHPGGLDPIAQFQMYAAFRPWDGVHSVQFASWLLFAFGLLALIHGLNVNSGIRGALSRFGAASAAAIIGITGAVYAVDGVALKYAADAWVGAPAEAQPALFATLQGVRGIEWGLRGYAAYTIALTLILLAMVIVSTKRVSRVIGYLMGLTGLVYIYLAVGYGAGDTALADHSVVGNVSYYVVVLMWVWAIWLLVTAWRMKEDAGS